MDKKKLLTVSLASVAVLGAGFLASHPSVVKAADATTQPTTQTEAEKKEALKNALEELEKHAVAEIDKKDGITDKEAAKKEALEAIGKEDLLAAIEKGDISVDDAIENLPTKEDEAEKPATPAPGAELVRNESGEVTEVKPINGGIDADTQDKINKRLDEEKTDVKDASERVEAARKDVEEVKAIVEAAKEAKEKAQKELDSYADADGEQADLYREAAQKDLEAAQKTLEVAQAELEVREADLKAEEAKLDTKIETLQNKVADLEKEVAELEKLVADNENNPDAVDYVTAAKEKLEDKKAELEKAEAELEEALKGLEPKVESSNGDALVQPELPEYTDPVTPENVQRQPEGAPRPQTNPPAAPTGETPAPATPAHSTPAPAETPAATPATPATEAPATTAPAVAGTSQDNTYQAPAAKSEDKKELPNTGGKDNAAIASLGFLGLLLGALPFVKRKN